ncbi:MAG: glycosyltransferase family 9 protein [Verrucomicrobiota bacterium]
MNISSMRLFDRVLGVPACFFLTLCRKMMQLAPREEGESPKKVLFVKLAEQGSTVLAYRALKGAVERYGAENVFFLVFEENRFILDQLGLIPEGNVIAIRTGNLMEVIGGMLGALRRVRGEGIDGCVDLEFFARATAVISYLTGARVRVGYHGFNGEGPYRGDLMTHRLFFNHHLHTTDAFRLLVEALEQPEAALPYFDSDIRLSFGRMDRKGAVKTRYVLDACDGDYPEFLVSDEDKRAVRELLKRAGGDEAGTAPVVLLNANCSDLLPLRRWPEENYKELAYRLLDARPDIVIALTGGPDEAEGAAALVNRIGHERCFSMAGRTSLRELLVLYCVSEVMVTNDSGPAHFSSLTPMDCVTLFGPETPGLFGSRSSRAHLLWAGTAFTPCVNALNNREAPAGDNRCMEKISVDDVYETVMGVLEKRAPKQKRVRKATAAKKKKSAGAKK